MTDVKWGYEDEVGPENWASLCENFGEAATFKWQSPVDLSYLPAVQHETEKKCEFNYRKQTFKQRVHTNSWHFVPQSDESYLIFDGVTYFLKDIHLHFPSEHILNGTASEFECHFVHRDEQDNVLVIGVLFNTRPDYYLIKDEALREKLIKQFGFGKYMHFNPEVCMPENRHFYHFIGSFTTPPTIGGVRWLVMETVQLANSEIVELLKPVIPTGNNRPVQPLNDREVWRY